MACLWNPASSRSLLSVQKLGHPYAVNSWSMYNKVGNKACQKFWPQREFSLPCRPIVGFCLCRYRVGDAAGCHFCKFVKKRHCFYKSQESSCMETISVRTTLTGLRGKPSWDSSETSSSTKGMVFHGSGDDQNHGLQLRADACHVAGWLSSESLIRDVVTLSDTVLRNQLCPSSHRDGDLGFRQPVRR